MKIRQLRSSIFAPALTIGGMIVLAGCQGSVAIRVHNASALDYTDVRVADQRFGAITAGATSEYLRVRTRFRYAVVELTAKGRRVTGQTLNLGSDRFMYRINIVDLQAGHLAIDVERDHALLQ